MEDSALPGVRGVLRSLQVPDGADDNHETRDKPAFAGSLGLIVRIRGRHYRL